MAVGGLSPSCSRWRLLSQVQWLLLQSVVWELRHSEFVAGWLSCLACGVFTVGSDPLVHMLRCGWSQAHNTAKVVLNLYILTPLASYNNLILYLLHTTPTGAGCMQTLHDSETIQS